MAPPPARTVITAPLSGVLVPIERVPDPVFAQKMVGDGVSIDPTSSVLVAPCDGQVVHLHAAGHAVTVATQDGIEVMMHIGLDTVQLKGAGFSPKVQAGARVARGDALIEFDLDFVATRARSLLTQVVITNGDRVERLTPRAGAVRAGSDPVLEFDLRKADGTAGAAPGRRFTSEAIVIATPTGLHARPASVIAAAAKRFAADVRLQRGDEHANAKSVVAIMGLEVGGGDRVHVVAQGSDAEAALAAIVPLLSASLDEPGGVRLAAPAPQAAAPADPGAFGGVSASPGLAVGVVVQVRHVPVAFDEHGRDPHAERARLDRALEEARAQLDALQARVSSDADAGKAAIFAAHAELLDDPDLVEIAASAMAKGKSAAFGWQHAVDTHVDRLSRLGSELLAARANDLRDVGRRVLRLLAGTAADERTYPDGAILVAEDLTPSDTASLDRNRVRGFCTTGGGATSHVAILARGLDLPAVAAIDARALELADGTPVVLDGTRGVLRANPSPEEVARIRARQEEHNADRQAASAQAHAPAATRDGHRIEIAANIGTLAEAEQALALGAEGVGLLRTEFLFLDRSSAPDEDEQYEAYRAIARTLGPERPLVIRTLDVGGDKPLAYLPLPHEANPFLGERGLRLQLNRPELLRTQIRAILRASGDGRVLVMFPMVTSLSEWQAARRVLDEETDRLGVAPIPAGIMVEVPAAALTAAAFARHVDFFSIGTNDLTQYVLAIDRGHPRLAAQVDGLHPAVLHLVARTVEAARACGKWVGVCGGIAADHEAVPLLVGLGVTELSVSAPAVPLVKAAVRRHARSECEQLARAALSKALPGEVRALLAAMGRPSEARS